jgi:uncharacterized protein (DUF2141 family)
MRRSNHNRREKIVVVLVKVSAVAAILISQAFMTSGTHTLTVEITGIEIPRGVIEVGLYNDDKLFPKVGKQFKKMRIKVTAKTVSCTFTDLANGDYAIATYHDDNNDGKCNKNLIGYPTEAYAFSNDYRPFLSSPSFKNCRFWITEDRTMKIKMVY